MSTDTLNTLAPEHAGFASAFELGVGALAVTLTAVALLARLLPAPVRS